MSLAGTSLLNPLFVIEEAFRQTDAEVLLPAEKTLYRILYYLWYPAYHGFDMRLYPVGDNSSYYPFDVVSVPQQIDFLV